MCSMSLLIKGSSCRHTQMDRLKCVQISTKSFVRGGHKVMGVDLGCFLHTVHVCCNIKQRKYTGICFFSFLVVVFRRGPD